MRLSTEGSDVLQLLGGEEQEGLPSGEEGGGCGHCLKPSLLDTINLANRSDENGNDGLYEVDNADEMDERFLSLVKHIEVNQEELQSMMRLCDVFKKMLVSEFPDVKVEPYGSTASQLGLRTASPNCSVGPIFARWKTLL